VNRPNRFATNQAVSNIGVLLYKLASTCMEYLDCELSGTSYKHGLDNFHIALQIFVSLDSSIVADSSLFVKIFIAIVFLGLCLDKYSKLWYDMTNLKERRSAMPTLRELREQNYISRKVLARAAGVSESTIVRMEEGKKHTTEEVAEKVLDALGKKIGRQLTISDVEGLNFYNVMRDRKQRTKSKGDDEAA